ncbi:MAG: tyrosine-type recombinase/integrase [Streptosporangiaceae bacterium]
MAKTNRRQHGEGSLYERPARDGRAAQWVAVADLGWKGDKRDRREFTGVTPGEALAGREEFLDRRRHGFTIPKDRPPTVAEWAHHWLHNIIKDQVQETTWHSSYRTKVELHIIPWFARVPLTNDDGGITEEVIEKWHAYLRRTGMSGTSAHACHGLLSRILRVAVSRRRLAYNPAAGGSVRAPRKTTPEIMPPDEDEIRAILLECEDRRSGPRWVAGLATGTRQGEALGLTWEHVHVEDPDDAWIRVEWELARLPWSHGCEDLHACGARLHRYPCPKPCAKAARTSGRKHTCVTAKDAKARRGRFCPPDCTAHAASCPLRHGGGLVLKRPKSAKSVRDIAVPRPVALALRHQRQLQLEERLAAGPAWTGWAHSCDRQPRKRDVVCPGCRMPFRADALVFTQANGMPVSPRADWGDWDELLEACGLDHYRVHDGRHHVATSLLEGGVDVRVVQELMGHSTPDFTRRAYQHVRPKLKRQAADVLGRRMWGER